MKIETTDSPTYARPHAHGRKPRPCRVGTSSSEFGVISEPVISSKQQISHKPSSSKQTNASTNLNNVDRDALSRTAETADVLLQISVHILKHQVKHRLAFFVLALLDIHQSVGLTP